MTKKSAGIWGKDWNNCTFFETLFAFDAAVEVMTELDSILARARFALSMAALCRPSLMNQSSSS